MSDDQREEEKTGILSSVSLTTVIASALAAGTSLVLSSKIGLAGSVIGTVVAAAASSFATQIYQSILKKSAEKVRDVTNLTADLGSSEEDEATNGKDAQTLGIMAFNELVAKDSGVERVILPLRDGLTIIRKLPE